MPVLLERWDELSVDTTRQDTVVVNLLNSIAKEYMLRVSDSSYLFAELALAMSEKIGYPKGNTAAYINIAKMHYKEGDYNLSLDAAIKALQLSVEHNDIDAQADVYNAIGLVYLGQKNKTYGREELEKAAALNKNLDNRSRLAANYFNLSIGYFETNELDSAFYYLMQAEYLSKQRDDQYMLAMINNRLGDYYFRRGQLTKAISLYVAILTNKNYQNDWEDSFACTGLANCYYQLGQYRNALSYGERGLLTAKKINAKWDIERASAILHRVYLRLGEYDKAYEYLLINKSYSDSLFNDNKEKEINVLSLHQKQIENEILVKQHEIAQQKHRLNQLIILLVVLIAFFLGVVSVITYRSAVKKTKLNQILQKKSEDIAFQKQLIEQQNQALSELNNTKDQLFSIISHDLRTPFAAIFNALELLKSKDIQETEKQFIFNRLFEQAAVTSTMLENLLLWSLNQQRGISTNLTEVALPVLVNQVLGIFATIAEDKNITIDHAHDERAIVLGDQDQTRIIFQNIIANAIKFTEIGGVIHITYEITDSHVNVSVKDNGIGIPQTNLDRLRSETGNIPSTYGTKNEKGIGIGLMLVKEFIDQNGGRIHVTSKENEGTNFTSTFMKYPGNVASKENLIVSNGDAN